MNMVQKYSFLIVSTFLVSAQSYAMMHCARQCVRQAMRYAPHASNSIRMASRSVDLVGDQGQLRAIKAALREDIERYNMKMCALARAQIKTEKSVAVLTVAQRAALAIYGLAPIVAAMDIAACESFTGFSLASLCVAAASSHVSAACSQEIGSREDKLDRHAQLMRAYKDESSRMQNQLNDALKKEALCKYLNRELMRN